MIQKKYFPIFLVLCCLIVFSSNIFSQFSVLSTSPVNGEANVDTAVTLSITFSAAIDTNARFVFPGDIFIELFFNPDSLVDAPDSITFSPDLHTVYFHNLHLEQFTDYRFCILNAVSTLGDSLDSPFAFSFTTNPAMSFNATVSGTVGPNPFGAMVFLFDSNPFEEYESFWGQWAVATPATGSYTVDFVAPGFYWPFVIRNFYVDEDGDIQIQNGSEFGYLDANLDYRPDSIFVSSGMNVTGINMTMSNVYFQTARNPVVNLNSIAQNWQLDAQLVEFGGYELLPNGTSLIWQYTYHSQSVLNSKIWLSAGDLFISIKEEWVNTDTTALPLNWLDSDTILSIAESNGGSDFRIQFADAQIFGGCAYFNPDFGKYKKYAKLRVQKSNISTAVWLVEYYSDSTWQYLDLIIDATSGTILNLPVTAAETETVAFPIAQEWSSDAKLWSIESQGSPMQVNGTTDYWMCIYYSPQKDSLFAVNTLGLLSYWSGNTGWTPQDTTTIKSGWLNSDSTMGIAENNGGSDYRQNNQQVYVNGYLGQIGEGAFPDSIVWIFEYYSSTAQPLTIVVDAYTGLIINNINSSENFNSPHSFKLYQNFPNPFNPATNISFHIPKSADVTLKMYNITGQQVGFYNKGKMSAGKHNIDWHAGHLPSGVYFYEIKAGEFVDVKKCILMK